ncbi:MAG: CerR family C-terminal domain-containing protein [Sphingomonadales bacterium]
MSRTLVDRGDARQRLIEAALRVFGEHGFSGASTRAIAAEAGANIAAIPYYFGGKEGLYLAVADHIADQITGRIGPIFATAQVDHDPTPEEARRLLLGIADGFISMMIGSEDSALWARIIVREQFDPTEAFDILYDRVMGPYYVAIGRLLGVIFRKPHESDEIKLKVFALIGQALIFRIARAAINRRMGWQKLTEERLGQIRTVVLSHLAAIIDEGAAS